MKRTEENCFKKVCEFLSLQKVVYIATTDEKGKPHLAVTKAPSIKENNILIFEEWLCPATVRNLKVNPHITVAAMDRETSRGYQAVGEVQEVRESSMMLDGYAGGELEEKFAGIPQFQWSLTVKISAAMDFSSAFHTDRPITQLMEEK